MTEANKPFTVKDRRHFTAEGEARGESGAREEETPPRPAATAPAADAPRPETAPASGTDEDAARPTLDFSGLLLSLGAQASLLLGLGGADDPGEPPDLAGAQAIISLLEVLRDKTAGRRTDEEERVLEGLLYELRMAYVARTRTGGA